MIFLALALVLLGGLAWPESLHAWSPGTHVVLGERVLGSLQLLAPAVADLLRAFPYDFLYGSIAADTTMAKKYAPADRHCHAWHVGREVHELAPTDALRAFGLGYLAHLAADVVAHNHFVPRQLVVTSSTRTMGHTYWESRVETMLGDAVPRAARELLRLRGMVRLTDSRPWQMGMQVAAEQSRWDLSEEMVERHLALATGHIREVLSDDTSRILLADPNGEAAILRSKSVRREAFRGKQGTERDWIAAIADAHFGIDPDPAAIIPPPVRDIAIASPESLAHEE